MRLPTPLTCALVATCLAACGGKSVEHGSPAQPADQAGTGGGTDDTSTGGAPSSGGAASEVLEVPGVMLEPGDCDTGDSPPLWKRLPSCSETSDVACRDVLDRMVLPLGVDVVDMAATPYLLYLRVSGAKAPPNVGSDPDLRFVTSAPNGVSTLVADYDGIYAVESRCEATVCSDRVAYAPQPSGSATPYAPAESWPQAGPQAGWNALATSWGGHGAFWAWCPYGASYCGVSFFDPSAAQLPLGQSYDLDDELIGLSADTSYVYLATARGELIQLDRTTLQELKRTTAQGVDIAGRGALLRYAGLMLFFQAGAEGYVLAHEISNGLGISLDSFDVTDVTRIVEEADDLFVATDEGVWLQGTNGSRQEIASVTVPGSVRALAFADPYLYVASLDQLESTEGFRVAIDALSIDSCTGSVR